MKRINISLRVRKTYIRYTHLAKVTFHLLGSLLFFANQLRQFLSS
jgi:hypothetical protein